MNPTTDHFHVPERAITKAIQRRLELPIKTIYECLIFFNLYLIAFISDL